MSDRAEAIRQQMRQEAAALERRKTEALMLQETKRVPRGRGDAAYGETTCPRCGVRSGVGCAHREAGDTTTKITSFYRRSGLA